MALLKNIKFLFLGLFFACSNPNSPESVAKEFFTAIQNSEGEKARLLVTEKSKSMIDLVGENLNLTIDNEEITAVDCVTDNEISNCDCFTEGNLKPMPLSLIKENGEWKVDIQSSAVNALDNLLDKFKGIDVNGILEKVGEGIDISSEGINEFIESIEVDQAIKTIEEMDSSVFKSDKNIESLIEQFANGLKK